MKKDKKLWWSRRKEDFKIDWFSGTGAGGQHRNKHQNCVRLTDLETNITTTGQNQRSRVQNLKDAFEKMVLLLVNYYKNKEKQKDIARSSDVICATRTYHEPDNRVVDHLTGKKYSYDKTVGKNDLSEVIEDRIKIAPIAKE